MSILDDIVAYKKDEIRNAKAERSAASLDREAADRQDQRGFQAALAKAAGDGYGLIAEIKRASPSKGLIRADFDPAGLAEAYQKGGAACLSVLTDRPAFQGAPEFLEQARNATDLPALRKDFLLDPYQVAEARVWGADAILLIMAILSDTQAEELAAAAAGYGLDILVEVHDAQELERALPIEGALLGVNNRNLHTFETDIETSVRLAALAEGREIVAESGIGSHDHLQHLSNTAGITRFLVGESLMRQPDVETATRRLLEG